MKFHITIVQDEDGKYVAECTDLPGCLSEGDSPEEAMENISEAIIGCLKSRLKKTGEKLKIPSINGKLDNLSMLQSQSTAALDIKNTMSIFAYESCR